MHKKSNTTKGWLDEAIEVLVALWCTQLGLLYKDLGLKEYIAKDVAGGRALEVELPHYTQLDGMHAPKGL